jgi:putative ABC transport system ATP-binding protein
MKADTVLRARGLTMVYRSAAGEVAALRGVDLDVARGQFLAVMGTSGSGKSTLLHILGTLERPTSGSLWVAGADVVDLAEERTRALRRDHIGFVFQFFNLLPTLTALENVRLPALIAGEKGPASLSQAAAALDTVGLDDRHDHLPSQLSGGEQQRVAIARALVRDPDLIIADEPTGNLDGANTDSVLGLLRNLADGGRTVVMATHDADVAAIADQVIQLEDGRRMDSQAGAALAVGN